MEGDDPFHCLKPQASVTCGRFLRELPELGRGSLPSIPSLLPSVCALISPSSERGEAKGGRNGGGQACLQHGPGARTQATTPFFGS